MARLEIGDVVVFVKSAFIGIIRKIDDNEMAIQLGLPMWETVKNWTGGVYIYANR